MNAQPTSNLIFSAEYKERRQIELIIAFLKQYPNSNTQRSYDNPIKSLLRFTQKSIFDITREDIERWVNFLRARGIKESSISAWLGAISSLFNFLLNFQAKGHEMGIVSNPVIAVERPTISRFDTIDALNWEQLRAYAKELMKRIEIGPRKVVHLRDAGLNFTLFLTGKRLNEVRMLRWGQIRLRQGKVEVQWNPEGEPDEWEEFPQPAWKLIRAYLELSERLPQMQKNDFIFVALETPFSGQPCGYSKPLDERTIRTTVRRYADRAGLKHVTVKTLRHTYAALVADAGASPQALQRQLGFSSLSRTRHYMYHLNSVDHNDHWKTVAETLGLPSEPDHQQKSPASNGSKKSNHFRRPRKQLP